MEGKEEEDDGCDRDNEDGCACFQYGAKCTPCMVNESRAAGLDGAEKQLYCS